jgi:hypothetical protein
MRGLRSRLNDSRVQAAMTRWAANLDTALRKSDQLLEAHEAMSSRG